MPLSPRKTVLIVADDHALRELYRAALMAAGYAVVAVEDGVDALRYIEGHTPSVVVLDLVLPRLGGHDVQRELASRAETRDIPILVVTGTDTRALHITDFYGVLTKPVNTDALVAAVDCGLHVSEQRRSMLAMAGYPATGDSDAMDPVTTARSSRVRHQARTVLVVDDEEAVQRLLRHFLELEKGFNVVTAGSVGEAILVLEHSPIDAVVLDVRMPRRSGLELLEYIRWNERFRDLPVLILTGAALTPDEEATIVRDHGYLFYKSENLEALAVQLNQLTD